MIYVLSLHFSNGEATEPLKHRTDFGPWADLFSSDWLVVKTCHTCQSLTEVSGLRPDNRLNSLTFSLPHPQCCQSVRGNQQLTHRLTRLLLPKQCLGGGGCCTCLFLHVTFTSADYIVPHNDAQRSQKNKHVFDLINPLFNISICLRARKAPPHFRWMVVQTGEWSRWEGRCGLDEYQGG